MEWMSGLTTIPISAKAVDTDFPEGPFGSHRMSNATISPIPICDPGLANSLP
jgi:hypothetical protein